MHIMNQEIGMRVLLSLVEATQALTTPLTLKILLQVLFDVKTASFIQLQKSAVPEFVRELTNAQFQRAVAFQLYWEG